MTVPEASVAVELERLRGTVATGFAEVKGSLSVLVERSERAEKDLAELEQRVASLERGRWPLASVGALCGAAGLGVAVWQATGR